MEWYLMVWNRYAEFDGRSRRKEYWMFSLIHAAIFLAIELAVLLSSFLHIVALTIPIAIACGLYALAALVPSLAVSVRRLHDIGKSGWWLLISFVPLVNLVLLVFMCLDSEPGNNMYGPNPKVPAPVPYPFPAVS